MSGAWEEQRPRRRVVVPVLAAVVLAGLAGVLARGPATSTPDLAVQPSATDAPAATEPTFSDWEPLPPAPIGGRQAHSLLWTGKEAIAWGGVRTPRDPRGARAASDGAAFDPRSRTWRALREPPSDGRFLHAAVWTGRDMFVWGGATVHGIPSPDGLAYNPASDRWSTLPESPLRPRILAAHAYTDGALVVWGGSNRRALRDGALYNPSQRRWRSLPPSPLDARYAATAVWTGDEVVIWGGRDAKRRVPSTGAAYDPLWDRWRLTSPAPISSRTGHAVVWDGREMFVWGGQARRGVAALNGAAYDPQRDTWRRLPPAPLDVHSPSAVWTGRVMVVVGAALEDGAPDAAAYDPQTNRWQLLERLPDVVDPPTRMVWTGAEILLWGGLRQAVGMRFPASELP